MKKFTLLSAALVAAMGANAQRMIEWDENGQYTFYPEDFVAEGSISYDEDEACFVCDGTGEGRIMLNLDGKTIDFSEVANIVVNGGFLLPDADDVVPFGPGMWGPEDPLESLVITDAVNGQINAWAGSRYVPNLAANNDDGVPFYTLCAKVDAFYFTARTNKEGEGEEAVVTGSVPGQIFIDNMVLTKVMEQDPMAITGEMWHEWDSVEANANIVGDFKGDVLLNTNLAGGAVFAGQMSGMVEGKLYADLSEYAGIYIKGTPGLLWRGLFNRVEMGDAGDYINVVCELNADGEYYLVFKEDERLKDASFIHLNSVKLDWSSPEGRFSKFNFIEKGGETPDAVGAINAAKNADVIYNVFGQKVDENYRGIVIKNGKKFVNK